MAHYKSTTNDHPELEPPIDSAVRCILSEPLDSNAIERVKQRALAIAADASSSRVNSRFTSSVAEPASKVPSLTRLPHRASRLARSLALAAAIALVITGTVWLQKPASAYGAVIQQLRNAGAFTYVMEIFLKGQAEPSTMRVMVASDGRQRQEHGSNVTSIIDAGGRLRMTLLEDAKQAIVPPDAAKGSTAPHKPLQWFDDLKSLGGRPDSSLGEKTLAGRKVRGFVAKVQHHTYTLWIDTANQDLVQLEHGPLVEETPIDKVVLKDFHFDVKLDEALFSFSVPKDYKTIQRPETQPVPGGEVSLVAALKGYTEASGGVLPTSISEWGEWAVLFSKDGSKAETAKVLSHLGSILPFLTEMNPGDYEYLGTGKRIDEPRSIIFWYRTKEKEIRAIYNDLTVATVKEQDLP